jgi:hemoglobin-like flavoprotein
MNKTHKMVHQAVLDSYHRCEESRGFFDTFYEVFFSKSPEIPRRFARTDMEKQKQSAMASVLMVLLLDSGDVMARQCVAEIAESHSRRRHDVRPELYDLWLEALCEAVQEHDPQCTPELVAQWRQAMRPGIDLMIAAY